MVKEVKAFRGSGREYPESLPARFYLPTVLKRMVPQRVKKQRTGKSQLPPPLSLKNQAPLKKEVIPGCRNNDSNQRRNNLIQSTMQC